MLRGLQHPLRTICVKKKQKQKQSKTKQNKANKQTNKQTKQNKTKNKNKNKTKTKKRSGELGLNPRLSFHNAVLKHLDSSDTGYR